MSFLIQRHLLQIINLLLPDQFYFTLSGGDSKDPEGELSLVTSKWTKLSGPEIKSISQNNGNANIEVISAGQYIFEFTAKDYWGLSAKDTVVVTVKWADNCNLNREIGQVNFGLVSASPDSLAMQASLFQDQNYFSREDLLLVFLLWTGLRIGQMIFQILISMI
jgi:hypothetical protein